jgi:hypothetical protein
MNIPNDLHLSLEEYLLFALLYESDPEVRKEQPSGKCFLEVFAEEIAAACKVATMLGLAEPSECGPLRWKSTPLLVNLLAIGLAERKSPSTCSHEFDARAFVLAALGPNVPILVDFFVLDFLTTVGLLRKDHIAA